MGIVYPDGGFDTFNEPSEPENVPLSLAGGQSTPGRNHVEHHQDLGDAVEALERHAAQRGHDHSGDGTDPTKGNKLSAANTHQNVDLTSANAIHHKIGTGATDVAAGNHTHDFNAAGNGGLLNAPFLRCVSTNRPGDPGNSTPRTDGLTIYETDTKRMRVWGDFGTGNGERWNILPTANIPVIRLSQTGPQNVGSSDTALEWSEADGGEDNFNFFNPATDKTMIVIGEPGVYQLDLAVQWGVNWLPEVATVVVYRNGSPTALRHSMYQPPQILAAIGTLIDSDYSQSVTVTGKLRVSYGDQIVVKARYSGTLPLGTWANTYFDAPSNVKSRLEMHYIGP